VGAVAVIPVASVNLPVDNKVERKLFSYTESLHLEAEEIVLLTCKLNFVLDETNVKLFICRIC
jgi:hypothetical protein